MTAEKGSRGSDSPTPGIQGLLAAAHLMELLRQEVVDDLGRQMESWDADDVGAGPQQAYRRAVETWNLSLLRMDHIARTLGDRLRTGGGPGST